MPPFSAVRARVLRAEVLILACGRPRSPLGFRGCLTVVDALAPQTVALFRRWCTPFSLAETAAQGKGAAALHGALTVGFSALAGHTLAPEPAAEPAAEPAGSAAPVAVAAVPPRAHRSGVPVWPDLIHPIPQFFEPVQ